MNKTTFGKIRFGFALAVCASNLVLTGCLTEDSGFAPTVDAGQDTSAGNNPPTIQGNPAIAVNVGDLYSFTPTADDPDSDTLTFSIQNKPAWAEFDSSTGRLSGSTSLADIGTYTNIVITVSDGTANNSMSPFSVEVTQTALGSVTLTWQPPTQNIDGTTLVDLAAFKIYFGQSPSSLNNVIYLDNPGISTYVVENLVPNTYYFASTSVNSRGIESDFSNIVEELVQ